jgi:hypothetical protein
VSYGVTRRRFLQMVDEVSAPQRNDCVKVRGLKRHLQNSLAQAWLMTPTALSADNV